MILLTLSLFENLRFQNVFCSHESEICSATTSTLRRIRNVDVEQQFSGQRSCVLINSHYATGKMYIAIFFFSLSPANVVAVI